MGLYISKPLESTMWHNSKLSSPYYYYILIALYMSFNRHKNVCQEARVLLNKKKINIFKTLIKLKILEVLQRKFGVKNDDFKVDWKIVIWDSEGIQDDCEHYVARRYFTSQASRLKYSPAIVGNVQSALLALV